MISRRASTCGAERRQPWNRLLTLGVFVGLAIVGALSFRLVQWTWAARAIGDDFGPQPGGTLLICGGGKLPDEIRERFCQRAGGAQSRIVIIPARHVAPGSPAAQQHISAWAPFHAGSVELLSVERRKLADDPKVAAPLKGATGVWLAGGDQNWLTMVYRDTEISRQLQALLKRGGVIGGSSAGAAAMARVMIASGRSEALESEGLGLLPDAIIDQHFLRRNRVQRFVRTLAAHPELIGFGVDERTALEVALERGRMEVLGQSYVLACVPAHGERCERFEVLKRGDRTSLAALREHDSPVISPPDLDELAASQ